MIDCYIKVHKGGKIYKDCVSSWLYSFLTKQYHDEGFGKYFNGSKVNGHSFYITVNTVEEGDLFKVSIRGIPIILNKILKGLYLGKKVRLGKVQGEVALLDTHQPEYKEIFELGSPLVVRKETIRYRHTTKKPEKSLDELVVASLERKYEELYGEPLPGLASLKLFLKEPEDIKIMIHGEWVTHVGYRGHVEIIATDEWLEFIQEVGLGNRTTYGFGAII